MPTFSGLLNMAYYQEHTNLGNNPCVEGCYIQVFSKSKPNANSKIFHISKNQYPVPPFISQVALSRGVGELQGSLGPIIICYTYKIQLMKIH